MKPFLLIQSRPEDVTSDNEYEAFLKFCGLSKKELVRIRGEKNSIGDIQLDNYSALIIGGGPFNMSDPEDKKSMVQLRLEKEMYALLDEVVKRDFPLMATCYGIGLVVSHQEGVVSTEYGEQLDAVKIKLNEKGLNDPMLEGVPEEFLAFVGHKEACEILPDSAICLASSNWCPVQMFKIKSNIYVTQFHPELDSKGLETRVRTYRNHGYFSPEEMGDIIAMGYKRKIDQPPTILKNFTNKFKN